MMMFQTPAPAEPSIAGHTGRNGRPRADVELLRRIADRVLTLPGERDRFFRSNAQYHAAGVTDYFFGDSADQCTPQRIFNHLRWGGQFIFASPAERETQAVLDRFRNREEFIIEQEPQTITAPRFGGTLGRALPFLKKRHSFFVVRKALITPPGVATDRYSYHVQLVPDAASPHRYVVSKRVPTLAEAIERLCLRFESVDGRTVEQAARKLVDKVFPVFLTREAALLKIVQRDLPDRYRDRFPHVLRIEQDDRGLVQRMDLNWLRLGGDTISQLEFARQCMELLHVLHDTVGVIHLDLRLDNMVVTPRGVGFLDFGSSVRVGEDFSANPMLATLFNELLSTSQIQRDLKSLIRKGKVTSHLFVNGYQKIDKAADLFYLVLQMNNPHANPDFRGLVHYDRHGDEARSLQRLSRAVLNPRPTQKHRYRTAAEILEALCHLPD